METRKFKYPRTPYLPWSAGNSSDLGLGYKKMERFLAYEYLAS